LSADCQQVTPRAWLLALYVASALGWDSALAEQRPSSAYLGPEKGRWTPNAWSDVVEAAAGGLLDESHWVDLKRELPAGKRTQNTELAQDLASLAIDGGLLVVGIEDHNSRAGKVCGVELAKLADRVDQVARDKVRPSLVVRSHEVPDPGRPGWGCLFVHVPPSAEAPHMVDHVYYGRGDRANVRLSDEQVRAIIEERRRGRTNVLDELRAMADDDPITGEDRRLGHLYVLAQPDIAGEEILVEFLARDDVMRILQRIIGRIVRKRGSGMTGFSPDMQWLLNRAPRAEGLALTSYSPEDGPGREEALLELVIREDGGIRLICGKGTAAFPWSGSLPSDKPAMAIIAALVLGLTYSTVALAGRLADEYAAYQGQWRLGIRMDRLYGAAPLDLLQDPLHRLGSPYSRGEYERVTSAATEELVDAPHDVTERLVAPLLRGLAIAPRYLPYRP
jgi:Schlafen, AlbA_2